MTQDEFTRLFRYMEKRFDDIDLRFKMNDEEHSRLYNALAELSADVKSNHEETTMLMRKIDRHRKLSPASYL